MHYASILCQFLEQNNLMSLVFSGQKRLKIKSKCCGLEGKKPDLRFRDNISLIFISASTVSYCRIKNQHFGQSVRGTNIYTCDPIYVLRSNFLTLII